MFEYKIQKAWEGYHKDMGLGRILVLIAFFNCFLFFVAIFLGAARPLALLPLFLAFLYFFFRPIILKFSNLNLFILTTLTITLTLNLNYFLVGQFDQMAEGLTRLDPFFVDFDQWLFGKPVANVFLDLFSHFPITATIIYDFMMASYFTYFILPLYGAILYYRMLPNRSRFYLSRYFVSVAIYFNLNYLFYLLVPVTGPQYFLKDEFTRELPFSAFGQTLHTWVGQAQGTFIDCFPSGHVGVALLVSIWLFRLNHIQRFIISPIVVGIIFATLALRYHYVLDIVASLPLAIFCYALSFLVIPLRSHGQHRRGAFHKELL